MAEAFPGRSEKCAGAGLCGDEGSQHGPPRNSSATEGEVFEIFLLPAHVKADGDNEDEIEQQNRTVDGESAVHVGGYFE